MLYFHCLAPYILIHTCKWSSQNNTKKNYSTPICNHASGYTVTLKCLHADIYIFAQRCVCLPTDKKRLKANISIKKVLSYWRDSRKQHFHSA